MYTYLYIKVPVRTVVVVIEGGECVAQHLLKGLSVAHRSQLKKQKNRKKVVAALAMVKPFPH